MEGSNEIEIHCQDCPSDGTLHTQGIENADGTTTPPETGNVQQLAEALFTDYVFAFEITALLLTISVVGAVVLSRRPKGQLQPIPETSPPWPPGCQWKAI